MTPGLLLLLLATPKDVDFTPTPRREDARPPVLLDRVEETGATDEIGNPIGTAFVSRAGALLSLVGRFRWLSSTAVGRSM